MSNRQAPLLLAEISTALKYHLLEFDASHPVGLIPRIMFSERCFAIFPFGSSRHW